MAAKRVACSRLLWYSNCLFNSDFAYCSNDWRNRPTHRFHRIDDELGYECVLSAPIENFPSESLADDAAKLNEHLEKSIRLNPDQYVWQYKRFKTRPEGEKRFY